MGKINVAVIGVGNSAPSPVQGIHKCVEVPTDAEIPGACFMNSPPVQRQTQ